MEKYPTTPNEQPDAVPGTWQNEALTPDEPANPDLEAVTPPSEVSPADLEKIKNQMAEFDAADDLFLTTFANEGLTDEQISDAKHGDMWKIIGANVDLYRQENPDAEYPQLRWADSDENHSLNLTINFGDKTETIPVAELGERYGDNGAVMSAVASFMYEPKAPAADDELTPEQ